MRKVFSHIFCSILIASIFAKPASSEEAATVYTSYFPHVMTKDPEYPGIAFEIVSELFKITGHDFKIVPLPWARAQLMAAETPKALIFPLSWTPTRDKNYNWSVNIFNNETHFISFSTTKLTAESARSKHIGVQLKSSWDNWLTEQGYEKVYRVEGEGSELIRLLQNHRIDAWYTDTIIAGSVLKNLNEPVVTYSEPIQTFKTYLATNVASPYPYMKELQAAMEQLRTSGRLDAIFKKYEIPPNY